MVTGLLVKAGKFKDIPPYNNLTKVWALYYLLMIMLVSYQELITEIHLHQTMHGSASTTLAIDHQMLPRNAPHACNTGIIFITFFHSY